MADPRAQWELDAETARLRAQADSEKRAADRHRREREKADEAERRRLQRMVEAEQREAQRKQADIERETERLRKLYGAPSTSSQTQQPRRPRQRQDGPYMQSIPQQTQMSLAPPQQPHGRPSSSGRLGSNGLYINPGASASAVVMSGANPGGSVQRPTKKKSSFFGLRSSSDDGETKKRLAKKSSAMW